MSSLLDNLYRMENRDINALARNPYVDAAIQREIAIHHHLKAREYLAMNPNLDLTARQVLWEGKSVVVKCNLVEAGHFDNDVDKIRELYRSKTAQYWTGCFWRMTNTFVRRWGYRTQSTKTPSDLLEEIYENHLAPERIINAHEWTTKSALISLAKHPNVTTNLAIRLSHHENKDIRQSGFDAIVRLKQEPSVLV